MNKIIAGIINVVGSTLDVVESMLKFVFNLIGKMVGSLSRSLVFVALLAMIPVLLIAGLPIVAVVGAILVCLVSALIPAVIVGLVVFCILKGMGLLNESKA